MSDTSSLATNILASLLFFVVFFCITRMDLYLIINYLINNSNHSKRRKGQSFLDWLLYRRYKDIIPKKYLIFYFGNFVAFVSIVIAMIIIRILGDGGFQLRILVISYYVAGVVPILIFGYSCMDIKNRDLDVGKIITRKKRNKK